MDFKVLFKEIDYNDSDDTNLLIHKMVNNIVFLLQESDSLISQNKSTIVFPLLRQVYEYTLLSIGLSQNFISIKDFVDPKIPNGKHRNLIEEVTKAILRDAPPSAKISEVFFRTIKKVLNEHTHASFSKLSRFEYENSNDIILMNFIKTDSRLIKVLVESFFILFINAKYKAKIQLPNLYVILTDYFDFFKNTEFKNKIIHEHYGLADIKEIKNFLNTENSNFLQILNNSNSYIIELYDLFNSKK